MQDSGGTLLTDRVNSVDLQTVKVAVGVPLSRSFDYLPEGDLNRYQPGSRVVVPFGRSTRIGVVIGTGVTELDKSKLKAITELLDLQPVLPADIVDLITWAASYYHHPVGEAFATALPVQLRKGATTEVERPCGYALTEAGQAITEIKRAPAQSALLEFLRKSIGEASAAECRLFDLSLIHI